jgi:hypothetical protein
MARMMINSIPVTIVIVIYTHALLLHRTMPQRHTSDDTPIIGFHLRRKVERLKYLVDSALPLALAILLVFIAIVQVDNHHRIERLEFNVGQILRKPISLDGTYSSYANGRPTNTASTTN